MHALLAGWRVATHDAMLIDLADRVIELQDGRVNGAHEGVA